MRIDEAILIMENERPHCGDKLTFTEEERCEAYTWAIGALKELSSAQFEERTEERTETHACDLIKRQDAIDKVEEWIETYNSGRGGKRERDAIKRVISGIKKLPSADRPKGKWIVDEGQQVLMQKRIADGEDWKVCSVCGCGFMVGHEYNTDKTYHKTFHNYCPNCGADMRGEK